MPSLQCRCLPDPYREVTELARLHGKSWRTDRTSAQACAEQTVNLFQYAFLSGVVSLRRWRYLSYCSSSSTTHIIQRGKASFPFEQRRFLYMSTVEETAPTTRKPIQTTAQAGCNHW